MNEFTGFVDKALLYKEKLSPSIVGSEALKVRMIRNEKDRNFKSDENYTKKRC